MEGEGIGEGGGGVGWIEQKTGDDNGNEDGLQGELCVFDHHVKSKMNEMIIHVQEESIMISFRHTSRFRLARGMRAKT